MPDRALPFFYRTKALVALPGRFTAFEHRQGAVDDHLIQALEDGRRQVAEVTQALGEAVTASRAEVQAVQAAVQAAQGELAEVRAELTALRRLVEGHLVAETESVELVGRLLERAEGRLDALEQQRA